MASSAKQELHGYRVCQLFIDEYLKYCVKIGDLGNLNEACEWCNEHLGTETVQFAYQNAHNFGMIFPSNPQLTISEKSWALFAGMFRFHSQAAAAAFKILYG